jgi:hypothetical protein
VGRETPLVVAEGVPVSRVPDVDEAGGSRTNLPKLLGAPVVGVAGSTLILVCGLLPTLLEGLVTVSMELELLLEALECVLCRGNDRIEETEDDVDFRPRRPVTLPDDLL